MINIVSFYFQEYMHIVSKHRYMTHRMLYTKYVHVTASVPGCVPRVIMHYTDPQTSGISIERLPNIIPAKFPSYTVF